MHFWTTPGRTNLYLKKSSHLISQRRLILILMLDKKIQDTKISWQWNIVKPSSLGGKDCNILIYILHILLSACGFLWVFWVFWVFCSRWSEMEWPRHRRSRIHARPSGFHERLIGYSTSRRFKVARQVIKGAAICKRYQKTTIHI